MCVVSMIADHYRDRWTSPPYWPQPYVPYVQPPQPMTPEEIANAFELLKPTPKEPAITQEEIAEFRKLLARAREYDKRNNEPNCELEWKRDILIAIGKALGVDLSAAFDGSESAGAADAVARSG